MIEPKKNAIANVKYYQFANKKIPLKFNMKKGWKIIYSDDISKEGKKKFLHSELFENGSKVKITGGSGFSVHLEVQNIKTKQAETIVLYFK